VPVIPASPPAAPAWVNPARHPVLVRGALPAAGRLQVVVSRGGRIAHRSAPIAAGAGPAVVRWRGGGARRDGRYEVGLRDVTTGTPAGPARTVLVDVHAPRVRIAVPPLALPRPGSPLALRVADVAPGRVALRAVVTDRDGRRRALGGWRRWRGRTTAAALLSQLRSLGAAGPLRVSVVARDGAGNVAESPAAWVDPAPAATPPLVVVRRVATRRPWVALTFDDGYDAAAIDAILDTLERTGTPATLCFNAVNASRWSAALRARIRHDAATGLVEICSHGYGHRTGAGTGEAAARADLAANVTWDRVAGVSSLPLYRPPYGAHGAGIDAAAHALGYRYLLLWSVDTRDWSGPPVPAVVDSAGGARPGDIVLQHAIGVSAAALPGIISRLRGRGLVPVRVDELLAAGRPRAD
jgi:peptidoglycan/xylan/chitin deacetylase (PgdA/CDA1 family)